MLKYPRMFGAEYGNCPVHILRGVVTPNILGTLVNGIFHIYYGRILHKV